MITTATIEFRNAAPVSMDPADVQHFMQGEVPPAIADHYVTHGMPRRGPGALHDDAARAVRHPNHRPEPGEASRHGELCCRAKP